MLGILEMTMLPWLLLLGSLQAEACFAWLVFMEEISKVPDSLFVPNCTASQHSPLVSLSRTLKKLVCDSSLGLLLHTVQGTRALGTRVQNSLFITNVGTLSPG